MIDIYGECKDIIPKNAVAIHNILNNKGFDTYFVGGALRDFYINVIRSQDNKIKDWDIVTTARHEDMKRLFNKILRINENGRIVSKVGKTELLIASLETTGISLNNQIFEVTPMNKIVDGEVDFTLNIVEDLRKRDFTINTIAYSPKLGIITSFEDSEGNYIDSIRDIKEGIIRSTYEPDEAFRRNRFNMVRAIMFANRFDFKIEGNTFEALKNNIELVRDINKGKISIAFEKIILSKVSEKIKYLKTSGLLNSICEGWNDEYSDVFLDLIVNINRNYSELDYVSRLRHILNNFENKELILNLYKSFGVNKEYLFKIM